MSGFKHSKKNRDIRRGAQLEANFPSWTEEPEMKNMGIRERKGESKGGRKISRESRYSSLQPGATTLFDTSVPSHLRLPRSFTLQYVNT